MSQHCVTLAFSFLCETFFETILSCWRNIPLDGKVKTVVTGLRGQNPVNWAQVPGASLYLFLPGSRTRAASSLFEWLDESKGHPWQASSWVWTLSLCPSTQVTAMRECGGQAALSIGRVHSPLNVFFLSVPPFPFPLEPQRAHLIAGVRRECSPKGDSFGWTCESFCSSCTGSDLITCPGPLRVYDAQLRSVEPGHSWISHSQACSPPDFCLLVKNFNFLWPQGSFYQPGKSSFPFLICFLFSYFPNYNSLFWSNSTLGWSKKKKKSICMSVSSIRLCFP